MILRSAGHVRRLWSNEGSMQWKGEAKEDSTKVRKDSRVKCSWTTVEL